MDKIQLTAKFQIQKGKTAEFKNIAQKCISMVQEKELGKTCTQYDWFFNADESECHVLETYSNSESVLAHLGHVGELLGQLAQFSTLSGVIYGTLSEELTNALKATDIQLYHYFKGA